MKVLVRILDGGIIVAYDGMHYVYMYSGIWWTALSIVMGPIWLRIIYMIMDCR